MATTNVKSRPVFVTVGEFSYSADESGFIKVNNAGVRNPNDRLIEMMHTDNELKTFQRYGWIEWFTTPIRRILERRSAS